MDEETFGSGPRKFGAFDPPPGEGELGDICAEAAGAGSAAAADGASDLGAGGRAVAEARASLLCPSPACAAKEVGGGGRPGDCWVA